MLQAGLGTGLHVNSGYLRLTMWGCKVQLPMCELKRLTCIPSGKGLGGCKTTSLLCHGQGLNY